MHLIARTTPNISGPLLMSRLRFNQLQPLLHNSSFIEFAGAMWNRRQKSSVTYRLLRHRFEHWQIMDMSFHTRVGHIYGTCLSDLHKENHEAQASITAYVKEHQLPAPRILSTLQHQLVQLYLCVFSCRQIISFPRDLLADDGSPEEVLEVEDVIDALATEDEISLEELQQHVYTSSLK